MAQTKVEYRDKWKGQVVVCIASGPSLTKEDCDLVKSFGFPVIVTNTTYKICPWADVLMAFDAKWWQHHIEDVKKNFQGNLLTCSVNGSSFSVQTLHGSGWFQHFGNSGTAALSLAIEASPKRILMLGYDCQKKDGKSHWHGDHPEGFKNCQSIGRWKEQFKNVAHFAKHRKVEIINCSRETSLDFFEKMELKHALQKN